MCEKGITATKFVHPSVSLLKIPGTPEIQEIFGARRTLQRWLDVEKALAKAEAEVGLIPVEAYDEIAKKASLEHLDLAKLEEKFKETHHPVVAMIWTLKEACEPKKYGEYVHWGATTQDIVDTATALQIKEATEVFLGELKEIEESLLNLADRYKNAVMPARTHGQQASPTTFGFKAAVWACEIARHIKRLEECKERVLVGNLSGAVGTFVGMGRHGLKIQALALRELGLEEPLICFHSSRDNIAEYAGILSLIASTLGKIGNEIYNLQRTEINEIEEPIPPGVVGSSTMPHKRNPNMCEGLVSDSALARRCASFIADGMIIEHERDFIGWANEFTGIPMLCMIVSGMLATAKHVLSGLVVNVDQMEKNFWIQGGLIFSEAIMFILAKKVGRQRAHEILYRCSMKAFEDRRSLKDVLFEDKEVMRYLTKREISSAMDPKKHIGLAAHVINRVLKALKEAKA